MSASERKAAVQRLDFEQSISSSRGVVVNVCFSRKRSFDQRNIREIEGQLTATSGRSSVSNTQSRSQYAWVMPKPSFVVMILGPPNDERHSHDERRNGTSMFDGDTNSVRLVRPDICSIQHCHSGHSLARTRTNISDRYRQAPFSGRHRRHHVCRDR